VRAAPAPQLPLSPAKFGAGKFCRFTQRKNKNQKILVAESSLKTSILVLKYNCFNIPDICITL